jgi:hypothetical protein
VSGIFAVFDCGLPLVDQRECSDIVSLYWNEIPGSDPLNAQEKAITFPWIP